MKVREKVWFFVLSLTLLYGILPVNLSAENLKPIIFVYQKISYGQIVIADRPDLIGTITHEWRLDKTRTTRYAAEFLQEYIEKITGVKMPIRSVSTASLGRPLILVGRSSLTDFVEKERKELPPEGFIIKRKGNRIAIVGEIAGENEISEYRNVDRGTLFGVYEFLEQFCGVRWYFPDELGIVVPKKHLIAVKGDVYIKKFPYFKKRTGGLYAPPGWDIHPFIRPGNTTGFHVNHTYGAPWTNYVKKYFPGNPELFALMPDGKRDERRPCYSNPENLKIDMKRVYDWDEKRISSWWDLALTPSEKYVRFLPWDIENIFHCCCPRCKEKWIDGLENSQLSNLIFGYAVKFANEINKKYPGRRLAAGAYCGYLYPPPDPKIKIPENMDIMICTVKGNAKLVAPGHWKHTTDVVNEWFVRVNKNPDRLFLFEYFVYPSTDAPTLYPHVMKKWFQFLKGKVSGGFNNGYNPVRAPERYRLNILNAWLWHKLLWDPDADVDHLMDGFYKDLFGPSYKPMKSLFSLAIERWEGYDWGTELNPGAVSHVHDRIIYRKIYPPQVIEKMEKLLEEAKKSSPPDSIYLKRVNYFGEAFEFFFQKARNFTHAFNKYKNPRVYKVKEVSDIKKCEKFNSSLWKGAEGIHLVDWKTGKEPDIKSTVKVLYDKKNLCVYAMLENPSGSNFISKGKKKDDPAIFSGDHFIIDFDLRKKKRLEIPDFYRIAVNPEGVFATGIKLLPIVYQNTHHSNWNSFWDPKIKVKSRKNNEKWEVLLVIPFSSFPELNKYVKKIKVQFIRVNKSIPRGVFSWIPAFTETYEYDMDRMGYLSFQ